MGLSASTAGTGGSAQGNSNAASTATSHQTSSFTPTSGLDRSGELDAQRVGGLMMDDAESRQLPTRLILSPVGSPEVHPLHSQSGQKYSYSSATSNATTDSTVTHSTHHSSSSSRRPHASETQHRSSSGVRGGGSKGGAMGTNAGIGGGGSSSSSLIPVSIRWQAVCACDSSSIPPRSSADVKHRRSMAPKSVLLVGEWNPSQPIPMHLVSSSADPSGFGDSLVYQCDISLPMGIHRYYFDVDGRPELAPDQPVENSRHVLSVLPSHSNSPPLSPSPTHSPTKRVSRSSHVEMSRSVPRSMETSGPAPSGARVQEGMPVSNVRSFTMDGSGSTPLHVPMNGTSAPTHLGHLTIPSSTSSVGSVGSRLSAVSPLTPGNFSSASPHPSAVAKLFHDKYDPDDEGWGQTIPEFAPAGSPGGSSSPVKSIASSAPSSNRAVGPPDLPVYLERALLNSGPVADDPSILPLPPRSMLNHVYERNANLELKHMILGITSRYRDKFVTVVMYKPLPHTQLTSTSSSHTNESSFHSVTPPSFSFSDELLGD
jgi:hypothetical protein